jgi:hypothetical protein
MYPSRDELFFLVADIGTVPAAFRGKLSERSSAMTQGRVAKTTSPRVITGRDTLN